MEINLIKNPLRELNENSKTEEFILALFMESSDDTVFENQKAIVNALNNRFPEFIKKNAKNGSECVGVVRTQSAVSKALKILMKNTYNIKKEKKIRICKIEDGYCNYSEKLEQLSFEDKLVGYAPFESSHTYVVNNTIFAFCVKPGKIKKFIKHFEEKYSKYLFDIIVHDNKVYVLFLKSCNKKILNDISMLAETVTAKMEEIKQARK